MGGADKGAAGIASLSALTACSPSDSLLPDLVVAQQYDPFLQQVASGVKESDDGIWHDFFRTEEGFLCYQREGDAIPRICVPKTLRDAILHAAHREVVTRTAAHIAQFSGGLIFSVM